MSRVYGARASHEVHEDTKFTKKEMFKGN